LVIEHPGVASVGKYVDVDNREDDLFKGDGGRPQLEEIGKRGIVREGYSRREIFKEGQIRIAFVNTRVGEPLISQMIGDVIGRVFRK
jgi:hypothetical protein